MFSRIRVSLIAIPEFGKGSMHAIESMTALGKAANPAVAGELKLWNMKTEVLKGRPSHLSDGAAAVELKTRLLLEAKAHPVEMTKRLEKEGFHIGTKTLTTTLTMLRRQNRLDEALTLARRILNEPNKYRIRNTYCENAIGSIFTACRRPDLVKQLYKGTHQSLHVITDNLIILARDGQPLVSILKLLHETGPRPDLVLFRSIISSHTDTQERNEIRQFMRLFGYKSDVTIDKKLLYEASIRGDHVAGVEAMRMLNSGNVVITEKEYSQLIRCFCPTGDIAAVDKIVIIMNDKNIKLNSFTYAAILNCYASHCEITSKPKREFIKVKAERIFKRGVKDARTDKKSLLVLSTTMIRIYTACKPHMVESFMNDCTKEFGIEFRIPKRPRRPAFRLTNSSYTNY